MSMSKNGLVLSTHTYVYIASAQTRIAQQVERSHDCRCAVKQIERAVYIFSHPVFLDSHQIVLLRLQNYVFMAPDAETNDTRIL